MDLAGNLWNLNIKYTSAFWVILNPYTAPEMLRVALILSSYFIYRKVPAKIVSTRIVSTIAHIGFNFIFDMQLITEFYGRRCSKVKFAT